MIAGFLFIMLASLVIGALFGWQLNNLRQAQIARWRQKDLEAEEADRVKNIDLYKSLSSFSKELEKSVKDLYEHEASCACVYCQIKFGRAMKTADDEYYHPRFAKELYGKMKTLQGERDDLRAELERRDRAAATQYPALQGNSMRQQIRNMEPQAYAYTAKRAAEAAQKSAAHMGKKVSPGIQHLLDLTEDELAEEQRRRQEVAYIQNQRPMVAEKN